jgi:hypothetical protein
LIATVTVADESCASRAYLISWSFRARAATLVVVRWGSWRAISA